MSPFFPTILLDRLIEERSVFAELLERDKMQDAAERVRCEVNRLESLKKDAENWDGPVRDVAVMVGYTPGHLYSLIREGLIENVAEDGGEVRVRYTDVLNHRLKDAPKDETPAAMSKKVRTSPQTNGTARPTRKNRPQVTVKVRR